MRLIVLLDRMIPWKVAQSVCWLMNLTGAAERIAPMSVTHLERHRNPLPA